MKKSILLLVALPVMATAQSLTARNVHAWRQANEARLLENYRNFLAIPNIATDKAGLRATADNILRFMQAEDVAELRLLEATTP